MEAVTAIDLFAGAGGSTLGLLRARCDVRLAVECDRDAVSTYRANFPSVELLPGLIESYTPTCIRRKAKLGSHGLGILSACPPCQGFSTLGACDREDERNDYVLTVGALVAELQPKALILENVPGLERDSRCSVLKDMLISLGYGIGSWVLDASEFCVPQRRRRFVLLAVRGLSDDEVVDPRKEYKCRKRPKHPHTVREVIESVGPLRANDPLHKARQLPADVLKRAKAIPHDGGSRWDLPQSLQLACHKRLNNRSAGNSYGRMRWDNVAPTMTTRCTTPACGRFLHPSEDRPITLREAAAFQTFPSTYKWKSGVMSVARQIGNAVPVRFAHVLALHTLGLIEHAQERGESC
ncbi:MAG: DNA cytosine methyltransferase [Chloroflexi bacterium]|nr:DNA cytosine methyltransferase [Chloroflexota bacterium]